MNDKTIRLYRSPEGDENTATTSEEEVSTKQGLSEIITDIVKEGSENEEKADNVETENVKAEDSPEEKGAFQKRIDKATWKQREAERKAEDLEMKLASMVAEKEVKAEPEPEAVKPEQDNFDTEEGYYEAMTDWKVDQKFKEQEEKQSEINKKLEWSNTVKAHNDRVKDYIEKTGTTDFNETVGKMPVAPHLANTIFRSEDGPAISVELSKNQEKLHKLNRMNSHDAAMELGKISATISIRKKPVEAPGGATPITKVSGRNTSTKNPGDLSQKDFDEYAKNLLKK
jgi:hypothetical protein|tara:strand:- start:3154 stop:4008 length:855 start_codon:yes stop_codon:yes gene_type:complete